MEFIIGEHGGRKDKVCHFSSHPQAEFDLQKMNSIVNEVNLQCKKSKRDLRKGSFAMYLI